MIASVVEEENAPKLDFVDQTFAKYDLDSNGHLDYNESKDFIQELLQKTMNDPAYIIDEQVFRSLFKTIDFDGNY